MKYECPNCGHMSLVRREYHRKIDGAFKKIDICLASGCKYIKDYTKDVLSIAAVKKEKEKAQGQLTFEI